MAVEGHSSGCGRIQSWLWKDTVLALEGHSSRSGRSASVKRGNKQEEKKGLCPPNNLTICENILSMNVEKQLRR